MDVDRGREGDYPPHHALWLVDIPPALIRDTRPSDDAKSLLDPDITWEKIQIRITHSFWIPSLWTQRANNDGVVPETYICVHELRITHGFHANENVLFAICLTPEGKMEAIAVGSFPRVWSETRLQRRVVMSSLGSQNQLAICFLCPLERRLKKKTLSLPDTGKIEHVMIRGLDPLHGQILLELTIRNFLTGVLEGQSCVVQY